jgi:ATP phosphoribosyltransferase regulatory subunit
VAAAALQKLGINAFSIDLNLPSITAALVATDALSAEQVRTLYEALSHKDITTLSTLPLTYKDSLIALVQLAGEADHNLAAIERLDLPTSAKMLVNNLRDVVRILQKQPHASWSLTIDAAESQGYGYHSGVGFSIFVPNVAYEVGRGGRYTIGDETATGFTLYVESLRALVVTPTLPPRVLVVNSNVQALQDKGYTTIQALPAFGSAYEQAKKLDCAFLCENDELKKI